MASRISEAERTMLMAVEECRVTFAHDTRTKRTTWRRPTGITTDAIQSATVAGLIREGHSYWRGSRLITPLVITPAGIAALSNHKAHPSE